MKTFKDIEEGEICTLNYLGRLFNVPLIIKLEPKDMPYELFFRIPNIESFWVLVNPNDSIGKIDKLTLYADKEAINKKVSFEEKPKRTRTRKSANKN